MTHGCGVMVVKYILISSGQKKKKKIEIKNKLTILT